MFIKLLSFFLFVQYLLSVFKIASSSKFSTFCYSVPNIRLKSRISFDFPKPAFAIYESEIAALLHFSNTCLRNLQKVDKYCKVQFFVIIPLLLFLCTVKILVSLVTSTCAGSHFPNRDGQQNKDTAVNTFKIRLFPIGLWEMDVPP